MNAPSYTTVIGLEVHVQLKTASKLFCRCATTFGAPPNTQVCPVCLGLPGSLPVLNAQAVQLAMRTGLALNCRIAGFTKWDRKNYFYPDLPKGYQISQFDLPICSEGFLEIELANRITNDSAINDTAGVASAPNKKKIRLVRAHLEEDAGKSIHDESNATSRKKSDTRIDLNRTGTPLLEIVSEPDMRSAEEAKSYLTELKLLLEYLDVSDCNMQEGSLRVDANVNVHIPGKEPNAQLIATPIVEVKNLNSFRSVERAIQYEAARQYQLWQQNGLAIGQSPKQTRGWDDQDGITTLQREKEESADYRYFPDPDLVPVVIASEEVARVRESLCELPQAKRQRFVSEYQIKPYDAEVIVSQGLAIATYFETLIQSGATAKRAAAWMQQDVLRTLKDQEIEIENFPIPSEKLAKLLVAIEQGKLDTTRGREVFQQLVQNPSVEVDAAIEALGIVQVENQAMELLCKELLEANPDVVEKVKAGNAKAIGSLVGQAKKKNPNADPRVVQDLCLKLINASSV